MANTTVFQERNCPYLPLKGEKKNSYLLILCVKNYLNTKTDY